MYLINLFTFRKKTPANIAKIRLKTLISEEKSKNNIPHYFPNLQNDLVKVICKYVRINSKKISIQFEKNKDNTSILKLKIILNTKNIKNTT